MEKSSRSCPCTTYLTTTKLKVVCGKMTVDTWIDTLKAKNAKKEKDKKKNKKNKKDKKKARVLTRDAPKKPPTAYNLYFAANKLAVQAEEPAKNPSEIGLLLGARWRNLSPDAKRQYKEEAAAKLAQYDEDLADFLARSDDDDDSMQEQSDQADI
jgi:hypothetical protein